MAPKTKPRRDEDAILGKGVPLEIEGRKLLIRRLGLDDLGDFMSVIRDIYANGSVELRVRLESLGLEETHQEKVQTLLLMGFPAARASIYNWLAKILLAEDDDGNMTEKITVPDLRDPNRFPMSTIPKVLRGLVQHQDFLDFFSEALILNEEAGTALAAMVGVELEEAGVIVKKD